MPDVPSPTTPPPITFTLRSGAVAHRWEPAEATATVVLQHGFNEYSERFGSEHGGLLAHLLDHQYRVLALDLWGHGRSPGPRSVTHIGKAVEDHLELRTHVPDETPVFLAGHSLGGLVTAASAAADPSRVAGVVVLSPALPEPLRWPLRGVLGLLAKVAPKAGAPTPQRPVSELAHDPRVGERAAADPMMGDRGVPNLLAATAIDTCSHLWAALPAWTLPTLIAHGTADTYTDHLRSIELYEAIASNDKQLELVEGGFHELLADTEGDRMTALVVRWITDRTPGGQTDPS